MPIKGLTDRGSAFPQIGSIRKGAKKTDPKKPGPDLQYFRIDLDERETAAIEKFNSLYPDGKPTDIVIILPFDDIERVWEAWREAYTAGALQHRCDGEYIKYAINHDTGEIVIRNWQNAQGEHVKCERQSLPNKAQRCKPTGRLHVIIPQLERLAYLVVHTTSIHDILHISEQLAAIREMNGGHIAGIPLVLRRRPVEISTPSGENGQRARRVKSLISIEADPEWVAAKLSAMRAAALPQAAQPPRLAAAPISGPEWTEVGEDDDEDDAIIGGDPIDTPSIAQMPADKHDDDLEKQIMSDVPAEPRDEPAPEPERKMYRIAAVKFNGLKPDAWHTMCAEFATKHSNWQNKSGGADMNHILASAGHAGYEFITGENVESMFIDIVREQEAKAQA